MNQPINLKTAIPAIRNWISSATAGGGFLLVMLSVACVGLSHTAQAQLPSPTPDGGYPNFNTAEGDGALQSLDTTRGGGNTAIGNDALFYNTTGSNNTATGASALIFNTTGNENAATGDSALFFNITGSFNTATGAFALFGCNAEACPPVGTAGSFNTATGAFALYGNAGNYNTATGVNALQLNQTGSFNTAEGVGALANNTTGKRNIAVGFNAGGNLTTGDNNIDIGALGAPGESNTIRIGTVGVHNSAYMRGISGATVASGVTVIVDTKGHLGTVQSSARFKDEIKPMNKASEAILALKPVTFRYKKELDPAGIPQFGLIAEQVEKVNPDLVAHDEKGQVYTVRYEAVNAMLLNEFLKAHGKLEQQQAMIDRQQKQIDSLTARLQKVSDQLELNKPAPQIVADNQ